MKTRIFVATVCTLFLTTSITLGYVATFEPRISIGEEYTDNYFLTDKNKKHEYTTTISPSFIAKIRGKISGAEISYKPSYALHDKYDENDTWRHFANFGAWTEIGKNTHLDFRDSFLYTEDPTREEEYTIGEEPITKEDTTIRQGRQTYYRNSARVELTHRFGADDAINLGYLHYFIENDDPTYEDSEKHNPFIGLAYWFGPRWGLEMRGDYTKGDFDTPTGFTSDDFDNWRGDLKLIHKFTKQFAGFVGFAYTNMDYDDRTDDYQVYAPAVGIDYQIDEDTKLSLGVGYFTQNRDEFDDEDGVIINGDLSKIWKIRRGYVKLSGSSGYEESYFGAENLGFDIFYQLLCRASYGFTKRISGDLVSSYRRDDYVNRDPDPDREDDTIRVGVGLTWEPLRWMAIRLRYEYRTVDSDIDANDYDENSVFGKISFYPSFPFRTVR